MELKTTCLTIIRENNAEVTGEAADRELTPLSHAHTDANTDKKQRSAIVSRVNQPTPDTATPPGPGETQGTLMMNPNETIEDQLCMKKLQLKGLKRDVIAEVQSKRKTKLTVILSLTPPNDATKVATSQFTPTCLLRAATDAAVAILLETNPQCLQPVPAANLLPHPPTILSRQVR